LKRTSAPTTAGVSKPLLRPSYQSATKNHARGGKTLKHGSDGQTTMKVYRNDGKPSGGAGTQKGNRVRNTGRNTSKKTSRGGLAKTNKGRDV